MSKPKSRVKLIIRILVSAALLGVVASQIHFKTLVQTLRTISLESFILISSLYVVSQLLSTFKWRILVEGVGIQRPITQFIRAYIFGMFVNVFGLGTVGGDVARAIALKPPRGQRTAAFASVVADRIHGLGVLLLIGCVGIFFVRPPHFPPLATNLSIFGAIGIAVFWFIGPAALVKFFGKGHRLNEMAVQAANAFPHRPVPFFSATLISLVFHSIQIFMFYVMAKELNAPLSLAYLFATIPLANVASTLPISIQGIGVRESILLWLFVPLGVNEEVVVAFGAIWIVSTTLVAAIGGLLLAPDLIRAGDKLLENEDTAEVIDLESARKTRQLRG